jgi:hypothetical protein
MSRKNFNETIWNRTRDLTACNAVPQPTALPRASVIQMYVAIFKLQYDFKWSKTLKGEWYTIKEGT